MAQDRLQRPHGDRLPGGRGRLPPALVPVRGSKDPHGPAPVFTATAWEAFMDGVKSGDFGA